ncbi:MAG: thioredoxin domain-containing protein [Thermomicrobiales bacterium]
MSYEPPTLAVPVSAQDWSSGPADAPVTLVEYGDFECPHCGAMEPVVHAVRQHFGDSLRFVFRHFPLSSSHPHAEIAAEAAEAAGAQGAFWPMQDTLLANQQHLTPHDLAQYAGRLGLDVTTFTKALEDHTYQKQVEEDFLGGVRSGVGGTPTFYINGARYDGDYDEAALEKAIQKAARLAR